MDEKKYKMMQAAFEADELRLFLDTHPQQQEALKAYRAAAGQVRQIQAGLPDPVCALDAGKGGCWDWTSTPWPWEMEG